MVIPSRCRATEVAIIGGGVIGLACAWQLARRGAQVTVFERLHTGKEASSAAGGMLAPSCEAHIHPWHCSASERAAMLELCFESRNLYPQFARELLELTKQDVELSLCDKDNETPSDWREPGILYVSRHGQDERLNALAAHGEPRIWNEWPSVWLAEDGQVESRKLGAALCTACINTGVKIQENTVIRHIDIENGQVMALWNEETRISVDKVVLCAGAWSGRMAGLPEVLNLPVKPLAGQMVQLRGERRVKHIIYSDSCYLVPRRDGRLLVGATVEDVGFSKRVTAGGIGQLLKDACELVPELRSAPYETQWAGLRPATPDGLPVLGATPLSNLFLATGHGRNGILLAPRAAQIVADAVLDGVPVAPAFSVERFKSATEK